ncbi:hypothetical protein TraAM80_04101 [Trypanosoma rangeli]|uniref:PH domain-containing protein n=1 Tax=Trypanosoma rangeli TaxID=5698 RepID=A0A422NKW4_TRYRA|nr:uncharacterized protein TraAM80_04101 [Trypanosoma rangeli]RNF06105.1 hypothetical protein TraAM80_04101 [Trypanosoma rangeli]|eukprot:RNF06105.1 hypothetical protein TraAM80_04101 [Trypanosoma rangeli]
MEVECKGAPPSSACALHQGSLWLFSKATGRFTRFNAFLHFETGGASDTNSIGGTLYLVNDRNVPFLCILIDSNVVVRDSTKAAGAFSIIRSGSKKTVLRAASDADKEEWMQIIATLIQAAAGSTASKANDDPPCRKLSPFTSVQEEADASHVAASPLPSLRKIHEFTTDFTCSMRGVLFKKSGHFGYYAQRWFELRKGEGLFYATHENALPTSFRRVPLQGLSVMFVAAQGKIVVPPSSFRGRGMTLKCLQADEFVRWREAIQLESLSGTPTSHETEREATTVKTSACVPLNASGDVAAACTDFLVGDRPPPFSMTSPGGNSLCSIIISLEEGNSGQVADAARVLTAMELLELEDLQSDIPCNCSPITEGYLESIGEKYTPVKNTPGIEAELEKYHDECLTYGFRATLQRLWQRFFLPIRGPYNSVNEHMVLLDLDVEKLRDCLKTTLHLYGEEVAVRDAVGELNYILCVYKHVREQLLIRLEIAAFCEQPNQSGLPLGVSGTIARLSEMLVSNIPSPAHYDEVMETWKTMYQALCTFRLEFDVFDESEETILTMENALNRMCVWLKQHPREVGFREEDLR